MTQGNGGEARPADSGESCITIGAAEFRALVAEFLERMKRGEEMSAEDYVTMFRLWNTIETGRFGDRDPLFERYATTFFPAFVEEAARRLDARPTKGMALYSRKYNIYLGGPGNARSRYRVEWR